MSTSQSFQMNVGGLRSLCVSLPPLFTAQRQLNANRTATTKVRLRKFGLIVFEYFQKDISEEEGGGGFIHTWIFIHSWGLNGFYRHFLARREGKRLKTGF